MRVQVPLGMIFSIRRPLMKAHGIWKRHVEYLVIAGRDLLEDIAEQIPLLLDEFVHGPQVTAAQYQDLKRPYRPKGHERSERLVLTHDPFRGIAFQRQVFAQHAAFVHLTVLLHGLLLAKGLVGQVGIGPDLAMRMRITGAHHRSAILKDLYVVDPRNVAQFVVLLDPNIHNTADLLETHAGNREVMARIETNHAADATLRVGHD